MEPKENKRDEIVQQAFRIFYARGFHATGVDSLLADSGISKRTVYKYFRSKEELIGAAIAYYTEKTFRTMTEELDKRAADPRGKILAIFDIRRDILAAGDFLGCFATNAKLEYDGENKEIEDACEVFSAGLENAMVQLCVAAGAKHPRPLARQLMILVQGAIVYGQLQRDPAVADAARETAKMLLDQALGPAAKAKKRR